MQQFSFPTAAIIATGVSLLVGVLITPARAAFTFTKPNVNEVNVADVLEHVYGGSFDAIGLDYVREDGVVTARRVDDSADQLWTGNFVARIVGRFSGYTQAFGLMGPAGFQQLAEAPQEGFNPNVMDQFMVALSEPTALARAGNSGTQSSRDIDNRDGRDHMITYAIEGVSRGSPVWLLFWEDLNQSARLSRGRSTSDFNDLIVVLRMTDARVTPIAVPLPSAFGVGLAGLVLAAWTGRRLLRSQRATRG